MSGSDVAVSMAEALAPLALAILTWAGARLGRLLDLRAKGERFRGAVATLDDAVWSVVRELEQISVGALKAASSDGKLSESVRSMLHRAAVGAVKQQLGARGLAALARAYALDAAAVDRLIGTRVETALYDLRRARRADAHLKRATQAALHAGRR